jgi:DNA-binding response OmpR family regulator
MLIIDDDEELSELLSDYLTKFDFEVFTANQPTLGIELFKKHEPDLIILDIMLPNKNGFEVCKVIRQISKTPIIIHSSRVELSDKIAGLDLGADDYIPKPIEPRELVARILSILRRSEGYPAITLDAKTLTSHELSIDTHRTMAFLTGDQLDLTTMEFEILHFFMKNPGVTLSREQVVDKIRGIEWDCVDRTIDVLVSRLRQKLKDDLKNPKYLKTIWGSGYRFVGVVTAS